MWVRSYEQGGNVSLDHELLEVGESIGIPRQRTSRALGDATFAAEVRLKYKYW